MSGDYDHLSNQNLKGYLSLTFCSGVTFNEFCVRNFNNYDPDQFDAIAIRIFFGKEIIMTLYALDKLRQEGTNYDFNKLPVKKFKVVKLSFDDILPFIKEFNFTLTTANYTLEDMQVINK